MKITSILFLFPLILGVTHAAGDPQPKNIILMISDGCGYNQITAANYWQHGRDGVQPYQEWPVRLALCTASAGGDGYAPQSAWKDFDWRKKGATDSAASATAFACGLATYDGSIGMDMDGKTRLPNIVERCEKLGRATGVVTTVPLSHATPAAFVAHWPTRHAYAEIGRQMILESPCEVIMGCGHPAYDNDGRKRGKLECAYLGGRETWKRVRAGRAGADADGDGRPDPWAFVDTLEGFRALARGRTPKRVLGVPRVYSTLQEKRSGGSASPEALPYATPLTGGVPTLAEMTAAALNVLDDDPEGFFVMIEGGAVDWACHGNRLDRCIEEEVDFNAAVATVIAWVEKHSNWEETLVIVTGDHETCFLYGPGSGKDEKDLWKPVVNRGKGRLPGAEWHSPSHTNALIPLFAKGAGSRLLRRLADEHDPVRGRFLRNAEVGQALFLLTDH